MDYDALFCCVSTSASSGPSAGSKRETTRIQTDSVQHYKKFQVKEKKKKQQDELNN